VTPERWAQFDRDALLDETCRTDPELRHEVEALLSSDGNAGDSVEATVRSELASIAFPLTGETISHYRILDGADDGGMGLVYRAEDTNGS
jgi:hypothetical protein